MDRYGTVMIGRLRQPMDASSGEAMADTVRQWIRERHVPGFLHEDVMMCDDGSTIVVSVFFDSEDSYKKLADDPMQAQWYEEKLAPMLEGDPQWLDGHWRYAFDAVAA